MCADSFVEVEVAELRRADHAAVVGAAAQPHGPRHRRRAARVVARARTRRTPTHRRAGRRGRRRIRRRTPRACGSRARAAGMSSGVNGVRRTSRPTSSASAGRVAVTRRVCHGGRCRRIAGGFRAGHPAPSMTRGTCRSERKVGATMGASRRHHEEGTGLHRGEQGQDRRGAEQRAGRGHQRQDARRVTDAAKKVVPDEHHEKVDGVRDNIDGAIGTEP